MRSLKQHEDQMAGKPGFVENDHLSRRLVAKTFKRINGEPTSSRCSRLLAANRVYPRPMSPWGAVVSYTTLFTLTDSANAAGGISFCGTFPKVALGCH